MINVSAVYENGVLRPTEPLPLQEGRRVNVAVYPASRLSALPPPTPEEADYERRLKAAKTIDEMHAVMATAPPSPGGDFDIVKMINDSRRLTGFRMPDPEPIDEVAR